jgi:hypothetical protein
MILHDAAAETVFFDRMEAGFPYKDAQRASALIAEGWSISLNAAFFVLSEICQPDEDAGVRRPKLLALFEAWHAGGDHPLNEPVLRCAKAIIDGEPLPLEEGLRIMDEVAAYAGQHNALSIASFASYSDAPGVDDALGEAYERIVEGWEQQGVQP